MQVEWEGPGEIELPVSVKTKATKYYAYYAGKSYTYTGKTITPKATVKYWTGKKFKTMPKSWYTCTPKKGKKIGFYEFRIKVKKKYQKKYPSVIWAGYQIVPKTPTIVSAKAGTGSITVKWKKFSAKDRKNISGFIVEYSTSKNFRKNVGYSWVNGKTASKCTINNLKKGKTYYVRVMSYKEIKTMTYWSKNSKKKSAKVK